MIRQEQGFTLFELLVVMVVFAILTESALLGFPELKRSLERNASRQQLEFDLQRARAEAVSSGGRAIVTTNAAGTTYTLGTDLYPFDDNGTPDSTIFTRELPNEVTLSMNRAVMFNSSGYVIDTAGNLSDTTVTLADGEGVFLNGTLYTIGSLNYN